MNMHYIRTEAYAFQRPASLETGESILSFGEIRSIASTAQKRISFNQKYKMNTLESSHDAWNVLMPLEIQYGSLSISRIRRYTTLQTIFASMKTLDALDKS